MDIFGFLQRFVAQRAGLFMSGFAVGTLAVVLGRSTFTRWPPVWAVIVGVLLCAAVAAATPEWVKCGEPFASAQVALALAAVYSCVPEPERIPLFLAVVAAYAIVQACVALAPAVGVTIPLAVALLSAALFTGAANRASAYVGSLLALASMLGVPIAMRLRPSMSPRTTLVTVGVFGAAAMVAARTIGIATF
jgi:hypothetical protein